MNGRKVLTILLRLDAAFLSLAWLAVFLPRSVMVSSNEMLGLAVLPTTPLTDYLTRSLAAMYAARGLFVWLASRDLERYRPLVMLIGWSNILLGVVLFGVDLYAGMPIYWTLGEGPGIVLIGVAVVVLCQRYVEEPTR